MIQRQVIKEGEKDSELVRKVIDIKTIRFPANDPLRYNSLSDVLGTSCISGIHSVISFSEPVKDFKGGFNNQFNLKVAHYNGSFGVDQYWMIGLDDEEGYSLLTQQFGHLSGVLSDYSNQKLERWQEYMICAYKKALDNIEDLYWKNEELPEDLFSHLR